MDEIRATQPREFLWEEDLTTTPPKVTSRAAAAAAPSKDVSSNRSSPSHVRRVKASPSEAKLRLLETIYFVEGTLDLPCFELQNVEIVKRKQR